MKSRVALVAIGLAVLLGLGIRRQSTTAQQRSAPAFKGLSTVFSPTTGVSRDTNSDGYADTIVGRIIVPDKPSVEDIQAAIIVPDASDSRPLLPPSRSSCGTVKCEQPASTRSLS